MILPIITLIGRPNVGKSTLFNRLTGTSDAIVADFPGLTRDRKYGRLEIKGHEFTCIDTGGIGELNQGLQTQILEQSLIAIEEADIVLFIVDVRSGLMPADIMISKCLRSHKKLTLLVANKTDGIDIDQAISDFWSLGFGKIYPISSSHGHGVTVLLKSVLMKFVGKLSYSKERKDLDRNTMFCGQFEETKDNKYYNELKDEVNSHDLPIKLAIVGQPNVGKSTLTNCILGEKRMVVYDIPGTTRDTIYIPMRRDDRKYILIDTAGVRKRRKITDVVEKFSVIKTMQAIKEANVVLLVIDANKGISNQDLSLLGFILNSGRSLVVVVNKWNDLNNKVREHLKKIIDCRLGFINFARIHFISALHGYGINNLFESVHEAYNSSNFRQNTSMLTRIMKTAVEKHPPPFIQGRRVKLKYAHSGGYNPLILVIHGNQVKDLSDSYKRYLINYFRKSLSIIGSPIFIQFREGENPFINRSNTYLERHK